MEFGVQFQITMKLTIRNIIENDYNQIRLINEQTQIQYLGEVKWNKLSKAEKEDHMVSKKSEFKTNVNSPYSIVAEINNQLVGFIFAHITIPTKNVIYIHHVAIIPHYQGKGIGVEMCKWIIQKARRNKIKEIMSSINPDNPKSIRMHEKAGFTVQDWKKATLIIR